MTTTKTFGPKTVLGESIHRLKHRQAGEDFRGAMTRLASALQDDDAHFHAFRDILLNQRALLGGRIQAAVGAAKTVSAFNCFVSGEIEDSMDGIMNRAKEAAQTMRMGGGIGFDFSPLRPRNSLVRSLDSRASGPVSFMSIYNAVCGTIASAGMRRGAMMSVLRIDHPDIVEFLQAKRNSNALNGFNMSVGVTDEFMVALSNNTNFQLKFEGQVYTEIRANDLWEQLMRSNWDWGEPGVLFIDRINHMNNLWYAETIRATNPCAEQPLPPNGACLLASMNLTKYLHKTQYGWGFELEWFAEDIPHVVRALDNVIDLAAYPLETQKAEALAKRRMGLGITGLANTAEVLGKQYGSPAFMEFTKMVMKKLTRQAYETSIEIAKEKGSFPLFEADKHASSRFIQSVIPDLADEILKHGIRNSHLISVAPAGTISLTADNVSSGIEPPYRLQFNRTIEMPDGPITVQVKDWALEQLGVVCKTSDEVTAEEHVAVTALVQRYTDSSVSKTVNVGPSVSYRDFEKLYTMAYQQGAKGLTTFRSEGKRQGILTEVSPDQSELSACTIDPLTGGKSCDE